MLLLRAKVILLLTMASANSVSCDVLLDCGVTNSQRMGHCNVVLGLTSINIISYNLHGLNQGRPALDELLADIAPGFVFCQEHWQTPANLHK